MKLLKKLRHRSLEFDLALRFLFSNKNRLQSGTYLAFAGLVLSTAILVVAMSAMSGFEKTLKEVMIDVTGHVQVVKRGRVDEDWMDFEARLKQMTGRIDSSMRFLFSQAIAASKGRISGVMLQGIDFEQLERTLSLKHRVEDGRLDACSSGNVEKAAPDEIVTMCGFIGRGLAKQFQVGAGDSFQLVVPVADPFDPQKFHRKRARFRVGAILDFGKNDYNERMLLTDLQAAQKILAVGNRYTGLIIRLDSDVTRPLISEMQNNLGYSYIVRDWREANENLFEAAALEKRIIFFVITILVIVSAFNVASSLYVMTVQRFRDIALLKALGLTKIKVTRLFQSLGLVLSLMGTLAGVLLGFLFGVGFEWLQNRFHLLSGEVYKIDHIYVDVRWADLAMILLWANLICFIAVLFPSKKGARIEVVEGLKDAT